MSDENRCNRLRLWRDTHTQTGETYEKKARSSVQRSSPHSAIKHLTSQTPLALGLARPNGWRDIETRH